MNRRFLFCFFAIALPLQLAMALSHPILPLQPSDLLKGMPATPSEWTLNISIAGNNFSGGWMTAFAERDFKQNPPPPIAGVTPPPFVPATLKVFLTDTGSKTDFSPIFRGPKDGSSSADVTYFNINSFPARMIKQPGALTTSTSTSGMAASGPSTTGTSTAYPPLVLTFLVKNRFLFEIHSTNLTTDQLKKYVASLDFSVLVSMPNSGATTITNPVILTRVDELHPQNTRSHQLFWAPARDQ